MRTSHFVLAGLLVCPALFSQVQPGQSLVAVNAGGTTGVGEMYLVDHGSKKVTQVTLPTALRSEIPNCITMLNPVLGYIGTAGTAGSVPGNIYRVTFSGGNTISAVKLNTAPLKGYNVAQIAAAGANIYFNTGDANASSPGYDGFLYEMPSTGGVPTVVADLSKVTGWPATATCNALCTDGKKVYFATWPGGDFWDYDIATKQITKIATLPGTKNSTTTFYPVNMHMMPGSGNSQLYVVGLYGDIVVWDLPKKAVAAHYFSKTPTLTGGSTSKNAGFFDPDTGDFIVATRDGHIDIVSTAGGGQASHRDIGPFGTATPLSGNSCAAIFYQSGNNGSAHSYGAGCLGSGSTVPTSVTRGALVRGNTNFALGIGDGLGGAIGVAFIGAQKLNLDLAAAGAPGCKLLQDLLLPVPTVLTGTGAAMGQAHLPVPLPNAALGFFYQWAVLDKAANQLGIVMSDAREVKIK